MSKVVWFGLTAGCYDLKYIPIFFCHKVVGPFFLNLL